MAHRRGTWLLTLAPPFPAPHPAPPRAQPEECGVTSQARPQEGGQADILPEKGLGPAPRPPVTGTEPALSLSANAGHQAPRDARTPSSAFISVVQRFPTVSRPGTLLDPAL